MICGENADANSRARHTAERGRRHTREERTSHWKRAGYESSADGDQERLRRITSLPVPVACVVANPAQLSVRINIDEHGVSPGTYTHCDRSLSTHW
ncbi:hypothetical protein SKAU_G00210420 [Synaphobranchus kaupii]|uniref:Uncharacterized protein n=1 Tax=Synaphobranchus kaupii TaxID=118154 RepID=A0A9Q1ISV0_SYNKA|nr:hypothetical protein SKAU_G00210420 [Synaphobranchus kaupii]